MWEDLLIGLAAAAAATTVVAFGMAHYAKTTGDEALKNPIRRAIHNIIHGKPGIRLAGLWKAVKAPRGTTHYHVTVLAQSGKIQAVELDGSTRYFPPDVASKDVDDICLLLRGRILDFAVRVKNKPGSTQKELLQVLTMSRKVFREYANQLRKRELVSEIEDHPHKRYFPTERLTRILPLVEQSHGHESSNDQNTEPPGGDGP